LKAATGDLLGNLIGKIKDLKRLKILLRETELKEGLVKLAAGIAPHKNLTNLEIELWKSQVTDPDVKELLQYIGGFDKLTDLKLTIPENELTDETALEIAKALKNKESLYKLQLDLGLNKISKAGTEALFISFTQLKTLRDLYLSLADNADVNQALETISKSVKGLEHCYSVNLHMQKCGINPAERTNIWNDTNGFRIIGEVLQYIAYILLHNEGPLNTIIKN
jgi:hypothetical protein